MNDDIEQNKALANSGSISQTAKLSRKLTVCVGARVMFTEI